MQVIITRFPHNALIGGGEFHTLTLVKKLSLKGFDFLLLSSDNVLLSEFKKRSYPAHKVWAQLEPVSVKGLLLFPFLAPISFVYLSFLLLKYRQKGPRALFCLSYTEKVLITPMARLLGFRVFWMEHLRIEKSYQQNPLKIFYNWFSKYATVVTVSRDVASSLEDMGVARKNLKVIYNGIDAEKFKPVAKDKVEDPNIVIGTASRLVKEKALDDLIKAFSRALKERSDLRLQIAGDGPEKEALKQLIAKLGLQEKVKLLGFQQELVPFLARLDIFALVSRAKESFGLAAAEAQAMELPVVATNISGLAEVVENQHTGLVVPIGDIEAISRALLKLAADKNLRSKLGQSGRQRVLQNFSENRMISDFEALLTSSHD